MWLLFDLNKNNRKEIKEEILNYLNKNSPVSLKNIEEITKIGENLPNLDKEFNAEIRIWLPNALYEYVGKNSHSISSNIRDILIEHCYGKIAIKKMRNKYYERPRYSFSISQTKVNVEMFILGKKNTPSKIACNKKLKNDLETLANLNNCTMSEYIRDVLYKHYFGNGFITNLDLVEEDDSNEENI
ncbi:hypothetical protein BKG95_04095 [Rodentibacter pneumotropicus]|uniref:Uncharacterized protein n=1 Tax=Rodentibacter pneumotropicus TaxID=758 RepID=A0AAW5LCA3_9PAST|nr:hypothetical protein [Rodentibacter pneumotropicus]MCQ9121695.1 hypothetical protein [Rodentibacter pneumotropicus]OOF68588.1 hypothetical protein BKG95_04095 [Rodentibacter pneumotropicus]